MNKIKKLYKIFKDFCAGTITHSIFHIASSTAFFLFLSFVPLVMLICSIMPYTPVTREMLISSFADFAPETLMPFISGIINSVYVSSPGILSFSIIVAIWSAGTAMMSLIQGFNTICDVEEKRNYFKLRAIASLYTIIVVVGILFLLIVEVFGRLLLGRLYRILPEIKPFMSLILKSRHVISFVFLTCLISIMYKTVPHRKSHFKSQLPGAIFASVFWNVFSWLFSLYVRFADFSVYGSLGIIVLFLLWLYINMYILMLGIYMNTYLKPFRRTFRDARSRRKAADQ